jgi:hypothetical protein
MLSNMTSTNDNNKYPHKSNNNNNHQQQKKKHPPDNSILSLPFRIQPIKIFYLLMILLMKKITTLMKMTVIAPLQGCLNQIQFLLFAAVLVFNHALFKSLLIFLILLRYFSTILQIPRFIATTIYI